MQEGIYINANIHERDLRYLQCQPTHKSQKNEFLVGGNLCSFVIPNKWQKAADENLHPCELQKWGSSSMAILCNSKNQQSWNVLLNK